MSTSVFICKPDDRCGYTFIEKKGRNKKRVFIPKPYSKLTSSGELVILTKEEVSDWMDAYLQALDDLCIDYPSHAEEVYYKVEEILKKKGNCRFL